MGLFEKKKAKLLFFYWKRKWASIHFSILVMDIFVHKLPSPLIWTFLKPLQQWLCLSHHLRTFLIQYWRSQLIQEGSHLLISPGSKMTRRELLAIQGLPLLSFTFYECPEPFIEVQGRLEVLQNLFFNFKKERIIKKLTWNKIYLCDLPQMTLWCSSPALLWYEFTATT